MNKTKPFVILAVLRRSV